MYTPAPFRADPDIAWEIAAAYPLGLLLGELDATPLPWLVDRARRVLRGHLAAPNRALALDRQRVAVIFSGPDAYVSPTFYADPGRHVPTWNYVVARAVGKLQRLDADATREVVRDLTSRFEVGDHRSDPALVEALLPAIVGVEVAVETFEAKLKLSQNRDAADREAVARALAAGSPREREVAEWMRRR